MSFRHICDPDLRLELETTVAICEAIDSPRALTVALLLRGGQYHEYLSLTIDPDHYEDVSNFADDYLVTEIMRKSENLPLDIDRKQVAIDSFWESEQSCSEINDYLSNHIRPPWYDVLRKRVTSLLGPLTKKDLTLVESNFSFGPGATTGVRGAGTVMSDKYDNNIHLTADLIPFYKVTLGDRWWEHQREPKVVEGSKFTTVPKNAKTDRGICVEPTLNMYIQKGIGKLLRSRLMRVGIDLQCQAEFNRKAARQAVSRNLCTIDLSAASDSISALLILDLFPRDWFELLCLPRSPYTFVNGERHELEKFSSMGNGYTFELETLLFLAFARVAVPRSEWHDIEIFGDDIIIPRKYSHYLVEILNTLGFKMNVKKSFLAGNFFESCGSDWFKGTAVRPFFLRRSDTAGLPYRVYIANQLRLYAAMRNGGYGCDGRFKHIWDSLEKGSPKVWRKTGVPSRLGNAGIIRDSSELNLRRTQGYLENTFITRYLVTVPVRRQKSSYGQRLYMLTRRNANQPFSRGREPVRGLFGRLRTKVGSQRWDPECLFWV